MTEYAQKDKEPTFESLKNLETAPFPKHLGGNRLIMVCEILEHEAKKNQNIQEIISDRIATINMLTNPAKKDSAIPDTYNTLHGIMEASKLKGGFTENISAENIEVSKEKLLLSDIYLMPYFVTHVLKIDTPDGLMTGQQLIEYYKNPDNQQAFDYNYEKSNESFSNETAQRDHDRIIVRQDTLGRNVIYDGNGRFTRQIFQHIDIKDPIDNATIDAWVLKDCNEKLQNYWVPTSKVADLMKLAIENPELTEASKQILKHLYDKSPECLNLVLNRAAEMSEYKQGANTAHDFVAELRSDWNIN